MWTPDSELGSTDTVIFIVGEFGQAFFRTKNVLKFSFNNCRGSLTLVDSCFSVAKFR